MDLLNMTDIRANVYELCRKVKVFKFDGKLLA